MIGRGPCKLPVQHIGGHWHGALAVGGMDEFTALHREPLVGPIQAAYAVTITKDTSCTQPATAVGATAGCNKGGFEVHAVRTGLGRSQTGVA